MFLVGDIFTVDEGDTAPITLSHLKASDVDTVLHELVVNLVSPPQFGYIENVLPSPGFEKSNTGISVGKHYMQQKKLLHNDLISDNVKKIDV